MSHEFAHHVVYTTLKKTSGESLVLHEGLADFFTFSRTGNACLGESICPMGSKMCEIRGKCLRSADNDFKFGSAQFADADLHVVSQFISGLLWDLRQKDKIPSLKLTKIVLTGVSYLVSNSGYSDFITALLIADKNLYSGIYCQSILTRSIERGLKAKVAGLDCKRDLPTVGLVAAPPERQATPLKSGICGTVAGIAGRHLSQMSLFLILLPLLAIRRSSRLVKGAPIFW